MRRIVWLVALTLAAPLRAEPVAMDAAHWDVEGVTAFGERDGRLVLRLGPAEGAPLKTGAATLKGVDFSTGTIEFDMLASGAREFAGFTFRFDDAGNGEYFYIRPHMDARPDSVQYTPVVNGSPAWQIFSGDGFNAQFDFDYGRWMRFRADVYADSMLVSVDGRPVLKVPRLKGARRSGAVGLTAVAGAEFANVVVTPIADHRDPQPAPPESPLPAGTVAAWQVSPAMDEADALARAGKGDWAGVPFARIPVESNGIGNLSRAGPDGEGRHSYVARFTARTAGARTAAMRFGFSDSVKIFLDGRLLYAGEDLQASRDYRFLGIVGLWDTLYLPLKAGANEVAFVVTDGTNGGTAAAARFDDAGVSIE